VSDAQQLDNESSAIERETSNSLSFIPLDPHSSTKV
jgi:hypothetical protein